MKKYHLYIFYLIISTIVMLGMVIHKYTNIQITFSVVHWLWLILFLSTLVALYRIKKWFWMTLMIGIIFIAFIIYSALQNITTIRIKVENSPYHADINRNSYTILKNYYLFEQIIAKKESTVFAANNTMMGIISFPKLKLLSESDNDIIVTLLPTGKVDTLSKIGLQWHE